MAVLMGLGEATAHSIRPIVREEEEERRALVLLDELDGMVGDGLGEVVGFGAHRPCQTTRALSKVSVCPPARVYQ